MTPTERRKLGVRNVKPMANPPVFNRRAVRAGNACPYCGYVFGRNVVCPICKNCSKCGAYDPDDNLDQCSFCGSFIAGKAPQPVMLHANSRHEGVSVSRGQDTRRVVPKPGQNGS